MLINVSQFQLRHIASKPSEKKEIIAEAHDVHGKENLDGDPIEDMDDVIVLIEDIQKNKNVEMCIKLDKAMDTFRDSIWGAIDQFDGNFYDSSMISIVVKIQQIYRKKM